MTQPKHRRTEDILAKILSERNICQVNELAHIGLKTKIANVLSNGRVLKMPDEVIDANLEVLIRKYTKPRRKRS